MESNSNDYTPQQYRKYNGQSVLKALRAIGSAASAEQLAQHISEEIGENAKILLPEVKIVLRRGIINGFLLRSGTAYSLVGEENQFQLDSAQRHRQRSSNYNKVGSPRGRRVSHPVRILKQESRSVTTPSMESESEEEEEKKDEQELSEESEDSFEGIPTQVKLYEPTNQFQVDSTSRRKKRSLNDQVDASKRRRATVHVSKQMESESEEEEEEQDRESEESDESFEEIGPKLKLYETKNQFQVDSAPRRRKRSSNDVQVDAPKRRRVSKTVLVSQSSTTNFDEDDEKYVPEEKSNFDEIPPRVKLYKIKKQLESESENEETEVQSSSEEDESLQRPFIAFKRRNFQNTKNFSSKLHK